MTSDFDVAILGAGISGLSFAHYAASAGLHCVVIDQAPEPGGCIHTVRTPDGFWFELGAHTLYNSYGSVVGLIEATLGKERLQERRKAPFRLWVDGKVRSIPSQLALGELLVSALRVFTARKSGRTVEEYYGGLVGKRNWKRVFAPLLSAVPSQPADAFPAEMLFKSRPRRKDFPRTFTFQGGLGRLVDVLARQEHVTLRTSARVEKIEREGSLFAVGTSDGNRTVARSVVFAMPPACSARLLASLAPEASQSLAAIASAEIVSTGVVIAKRELALPRMMGLASLSDDFLSVVSRDVVEDERFRGLAFHFRPGLTLDQRLDRIAGVTGVPRTRFAHVAEHETSLPSPRLGHTQIVAALDANLAGRGVYVTGNFFGGLAIEDCVLRSRAESDRLLREVHRE